jgi:hypothetical protein
LRKEEGSFTSVSTTETIENFDLIYPDDDARIDHIRNTRSNAIDQAKESGQKVIIVKVLPGTRMVNDLIKFKPIKS